MAEIPVERKTGGFPWWLIPLILLLLLLPLFYFMCGRTPNNVVVDNTNSNRVITTTNINNNRVINADNSTAVVFNEEDRIREANERARLAMEKYYPNGSPQQVVDALNLSVVNFAKGSSDIPEERKALLKQAAEQLKKSPAETRVQIDGYTDNDGDPESNQKLSERRAAAVRNQLVSDGVPPAMLSMKGYGETNPKASNDTPEGKFENRRIEYKVATSETTAIKVVPNSNSGNK